MINHLKNRTAQEQSIAWASGLHVVTGTPIWSKNSGASPSRQCTIRQVLGKGEWNGIKGIWWDGINIPAADYHFLTGSSPTQTGDNSWFSEDSAHPGYAILDYKTPTGSDFDSKETTPSGLRVIAETENFRDWNSSGVEQTGNYGYTTNGARIWADWYLQSGGQTDRINWSNWVAWRDYIGGTETQDYSAIADFVGFGLTTSFYNGIAFDTFVSKRVEPFIDFNVGAGSPALGVDVDDFSVRSEGRLKAKYTETYTFTLTHTHGVKVWINGTLELDEWASSGTHTFTKALTANSFYDIKIEWKHTTGTTANLKLQWNSTSQTIEVIPPERLYPKTESKTRYETHVAFASPTDLDAVLKTILLVNNSVMQDVDGKMNFYCFEQLSESFDITEDMVTDGTLKLVNRTFKKTDIKTRWEAVFRDLDSQYLESCDAINPCFRDYSGSIDDPNESQLTEVVSLPNMTRFQAIKILDHLAQRKLFRRNFFELQCDARTFQVVAGDLVTLTHSQFGIADQTFLVTESRDQSSESTADDRTFILQYWS
jgi:hypothetical protein